MEITAEQIASCIDHAMLAPTGTSEDIRHVCDEAIQYGFCAVFVNGKWLTFTDDLLIDSNVKVGAVASFPFGTDTTESKVLQTKEAINNGADEVDIVADLSAIIEGNEKYLVKQFESIIKVCRSVKPAVPLKVIIEAAALTHKQKIFICQLVSKCGIDFVKTSTGFHSSGGAAVEDVKLMKEYAGNCKVKASGGIRTAKQAIEMIKAGADRLGTSSGARIIEEIRSGNIQ